MRLQQAFKERYQLLRQHCMILNTWVPAAAAGFHRLEKIQGNRFVFRVHCINVLLYGSKAILQKQPVAAVYHRAAKQSNGSFRVFRFYQLHKSNIIRYKNRAVKRLSRMHTVAVAQVVRAQRNTYNFW